MAAAKYLKGASAEEDSADTVRVRAEASRRYIRSLHQYPVLSAQWLDLVDSLDQLARMTQLELAMPQNMKVVETQGRDNQSAGTLWDQEQHENAIRILVEEAKVNLCVRIMEDYKRWQYASLMEDRERKLDRKCQRFEESLGLLLWRSFIHLETLQLTDVRLLLEHCTLVLDHCSKIAIDAPGNVKMQETMVLYYWASMMKHSESLNNEELLAKVQECRLLHLVTTHLTEHATKYPLDVLSNVAAGFASLSENEDFKTDWKRFFDSHEEKVAFLSLESLLVEPILREDASKKKHLRPLTDFFNVLKRNM